MYRGITLKIIREKVNLDDTSAIERILNNTQFNFSDPNNAILYMDGEDISVVIKSSIVAENVSQVSSISEVRIKLVEYQRKMALGRNVVLEGRDIGTVVFPNAEYKFYLIADIGVRAERRKQEIEATGDHMTKEEIIMHINDRDQKDSSRQLSPLMKAEDAIEVDTTDLKIEEQVNYIINIINYNQKGA